MHGQLSVIDPEGVVSDRRMLVFSSRWRDKPSSARVGDWIGKFRIWGNLTFRLIQFEGAYVRLIHPIMPMRQAGVYLRKFAIFVHRWLGLAFCLLFALWFVSGIVMMYSDYPSVGSKERLSKAAPLALGAIRLPPQTAYTALHKSEPPDQVALTMLDGRPIYRFRRRRSLALVYADNGEVFRWLSQATAERIAAGWTGQPEGTA